MNLATGNAASAKRRVRTIVSCVFKLIRGVDVMPEGTVKKLIVDKGFGFIEGDRGDIFFHHSALIGTTIEELHEGQRVEYEVGSGPKGPRAENVKPA